MLRLPDVTLFGIDCLHPDLTIAAMKHSMNLVQFGDIILLANVDRITQSKLPKGIRVIKHIQSDLKTSPKDMPNLVLPVDYERDVLRQSAEFLRTKHLLHIEWDAAVLNPLAWTDDFLEYDYIGAPWPDHHDPGWPRCDQSNNVGNGGFSLKSSKFCKLVRQATDEFHGDTAMISSDRWQCRTIRPWMEGKGIKYAHEEAAAMFSCEGRIYAGAFGFHGRITAQMNNWGGVLFDPIKK